MSVKNQEAALARDGCVIETVPVGMLRVEG